MKTQFQIQLIGYTWSGHRAAYSYNTKSIPDDMEAVKRIAGDFESVVDYRVVKVETGGDWAHQWTKRGTVKQWDDTEAHFDEYLELSEGV
jgi:hypothetical protein